jgi:hypothetical protein
MAFLRPNLPAFAFLIANLCLNPVLAQIECGAEPRSTFLTDDEYGSPEPYKLGVIFPLLADLLCNETCRDAAEAGVQNSCRIGIELMEGIAVTLSHSWQDPEEEASCKPSNFVSAIKPTFQTASSCQGSWNPC